MPNHPCRVGKCLKHKIQNTKTEYLELIPIHPHSLTEFGNTKSLNEKCKDKRLKDKIQNTKTENLELMLIHLIRVGKCQAHSIHPNKIGKKKAFENSLLKD